MSTNQLTIDDDGNVCYSAYVRRGSMLYLREALDFDDPDHPYSLLLNIGLDPAQFGMEHPHEAEFKNMSRAQLIQQLIDARNTIKSMEQFL